MFDYKRREKIKAMIPKSLRGVMSTFYRLMVLTNFYLRENTYRIKKSSDGFLLEFTEGVLRDQRIIMPHSGRVDFYYLIWAGMEVQSYFQFLPNTAGLIIDAGSYPGDFAVLASRMFPKVPIYAFEPDPKNFEYLQEVIAANNAQSVIPLRLGISNVIDRRTFVADGASSRVYDGKSYGYEIFEAETTTIDEFMKSYGKENPFIKMDIEGHEIEAVNGAEETLRRGSMWAIASYHIVNGQQTWCCLKEIFERYGYETRLCYPKHLTLYAWRG